MDEELPFGAAEVVEDPYFYVERKMAPHRLPAIAQGDDVESLPPPPDFWSRPIANFQVFFGGAGGFKVLVPVLWVPGGNALV